MRYYTDCRETPSVKNCTVAIFADTKDEVVEAAVQHAISVHGHSENEAQELRKGTLDNLKSTEQDIAA